MPRIKIILRFVLSFLLIGVGINHFVHASNFEKIVPPAIPFPMACVYISGIFEIFFGAGLLFAPFRRYAAMGLIVLLIAVFPANIYMFTSGLFTQFPRWALVVRLPVQILLIAWAAWYVKKEPGIKHVKNEEHA